MKSMFQGNWTDVHVTEYLKEAVKTDVFWLGNRTGHDGSGKEIRRFPMDVLEGIFHITKNSTPSMQNQFEQGVDGIHSIVLFTKLYKLWRPGLESNQRK